MISKEALDQPKKIPAEASKRFLKKEVAVALAGVGGVVGASILAGEYFKQGRYEEGYGMAVLAGGLAISTPITVFALHIKEEKRLAKEDCKTER